MEKNQEIKTDYLIRLSRAIFELARLATSQAELATLKDVANKAANLFDNAEEHLHPDLGQNLVEFVLLKIDIQRTPNTNTTALKTYEQNVESIINSLEDR